MAKATPIDYEIQFVSILNEMVQAYQEIYVVKMRHVRDRVLNNRNYMSGLTGVFGEIKEAYVQKTRMEKKTLNSKILQLLHKKNASVAVLLSGKRKLSGDINQRVFDGFREYVKAHPDLDIVIVGEIGRQLYRRSGLKKDYKFFDLSEDQIDISVLKPVLEYILPYEDTQLFYGKYISLVNQKEEHTSLRGIEESEVKEVEPAKRKKYLFEPSLEELLVFFESQIAASLFKQTTHESYLAQTGSRLQALQTSSVNIEERMEKLYKVRLKLVKRRRNKKQLQGLAGMSLWGVR
jgi:ATP synthase F1 gamma subunit